MVKTGSERTRDKEDRKKKAGLHEYRVWAAGKDGKRDPEIGAALNEYAAELTAQRKKEHGDG